MRKTYLAKRVNSLFYQLHKMSEEELITELKYLGKEASNDFPYHNNVLNLSLRRAYIGRGLGSAFASIIPEDSVHITGTALVTESFFVGFLREYPGNVTVDDKFLSRAIHAAQAVIDEIDACEESLRIRKYWTPPSIQAKRDEERSRLDGLFKE